MGQALLWAFVVVLVLACGALGSGLLALLRQQGRLLIRLERLEAAAGGEAAEAQMPAGVDVGTEVEPFALPDLDGATLALDDLHGRKVLLVHWSPSCGFCEQIAGELAGLEGSLRRQNAELVLLSYGEADANRALAEEHGLRARILLQDQGDSIPLFTGLGTPVAYLVDERGRTASPLALGAEQVPALARAVADGRKRLGSERSLAESRLERDGLAPGTVAPAFDLEDVRGGRVSLDDYRGRDLLLVFSDPECGPCNALLPDLARLQGDVPIVMVSRGDVGENRAKAEEHGLDFPVAVQKGWKLSKEYGIFATPVAFLVDEAGVIAAPVAKGKDEIVDLARRAPARKEAPLTH